MASSVDAATGLLAVISVAGMIIQQVHLKRRTAKARVRTLESRVGQLEARLEDLENSDDDCGDSHRRNRSGGHSRSSYSRHSRSRSQRERSVPPAYHEVFPSHNYEAVSCPYLPQRMPHPYYDQSWPNRYPSNIDILNHWRGLSNEQIRSIIVSPYTSSERRTVAKAVLCQRGWVVDDSGKLQRTSNTQQSRNNSTGPVLGSPSRRPAARRAITSPNRGEIQWEEDAV